LRKVLHTILLGQVGVGGNNNPYNKSTKPTPKIGAACFKR
jgi:hypothetical protein